MVSGPVPRSSSLGSSPVWGRYAVFLGRYLTLTVPCSTQEYKWVVTNCWGEGVTCNGLAYCPWGVEILLAASSYKSQDKLCQL